MEFGIKTFEASINDLAFIHLKNKLPFYSFIIVHFSSHDLTITLTNLFMKANTNWNDLLMLYHNFIMSESSKRKKALALQELHLSPEFIYLVHDEALASDASYTLELWKSTNLSR